MSTQTTTRRHPPGLPYLFFTEMWERFGFYLMLGIFTLYMIGDTAKGGLGLSKDQAADIFGTYAALVYLTPFIGGLLADRYLGYRLSIIIGGLLMAAGYLGLALPGWPAFWGALFLIIIGNGFFKPNISTLLGNLYSQEQYKPYKDAGYNIFYMGINIGAFLCNFVAAYLRIQYGWGYAFAAGGVGMLLGLAIFLVGAKHVREADVIKPPQPEDMPLTTIAGLIFLPALGFGLLGWFVPQWLFGGPVFGTSSADAFMFACIPIIIFYASLWWRASQEDRESVGALLALCGTAIIFWAIFFLAGTSLTIWAEQYTARDLPPALEPAAAAVGMVQEVDTKLVDAKGKGRPEVNAYFVEQKDKEGKPILVERPDNYLLNLPKADWPKEGAKLKLMPTELFQSINPFFVVVLTPVVVGFFNWLKRRGSEPSTPGKIGYGLLVGALSPLVMVGAVYMTSIYTEKTSAGWLVGAYCVMTIGELCLSPMGLSLVSKLSPVRLTALMMGAWFLSTSIGGKLSGMLAGTWDSYQNKALFFIVNSALLAVAAGAVFLMLPWLRRVVKAKTGTD